LHSVKSHFVSYRVPSRPGSSCKSMRQLVDFRCYLPYPSCTPTHHSREVIVVYLGPFRSDPLFPICLLAIAGKELKQNWSTYLFLSKRCRNRIASLSRVYQLVTIRVCRQQLFLYRDTAQSISAL